MKRLYITIAVLFFWMLSAMADEGKLRIAVFDPISSGVFIDDGTKVAIREIISSTIVNTGKHDIVERSLLEKVMEEQQFSNSGVVNDNQIIEIGKLAGANKVVVFVVALTGGRNMLSLKMIDVKTASIERQKVKVIAQGELINVVEPMTLDLIGAESADDKILPITDATKELSVITNSKNNVNTELGESEVVFYLPPNPQLKDVGNLIVILDGDMVGEGTIEGGFNIKVMDVKLGSHKIKIKGDQGMLLGNIIPTSYKIDTKKERYLEFKLRKIAGGKTTLGTGLNNITTESQNHYQIILKN